MLIPCGLNSKMWFKAASACVCAAQLVGVMLSDLHAEVPAVTALFPSGVQAGQSVTAKVQGAVGTAPLEVWTDRTDLTVKVGEKPEELLVTTTSETRPGIVWFRWHNAEGASELRSFLVGTDPEANEVEPNNATQAPQPVAGLPVTMNGTLEQRGDLDNYAVTLKAGETLVASLEASRTFASPMDGVLQLVSPSGFVVAQNEDSFAFDPQLVWTAPADGTWLVRVFAFPMSPDSTIQYFGSPNSIYRLHLTTGPVVSHVAPLVKQAGEVAAGGWNLTGDTLSLVGEPGQLRLAALASGVVPFTPFKLDHLPERVGASFIEDTATTTPQLVTLHASITGVVETSGDVDSYRFLAIKGQAIRIRTHTRSIGSALDSLIRFRDGDGKLITEQDDSGELPDPNFDISIPSDGEYIIEITDRYGTGSPQHFYSLVIGPELPHFELMLAANRFTLDRSKPLEIPVTINRFVGLNVPIQFTVEGLPAGVTLEPVESKPEGETAKAVTLKLSVTADAAAAKGPIRVIGTTTGPDQRTAAQAPIEGVKATSEQLWITLPSKAP